VNRGGSWNNDARNCRCANRNNNWPGNENNNLGFRVSRARRSVEHIRRTGRSPVPRPAYAWVGANPKMPGGAGRQTLDGPAGPY